MNESQGNNTSTGDTDENPDEEFLKRLNSVKEQLLILLSKAEDTSVNDKELMKRLDAVNQTLIIIETKLKDAEGKTVNADQNSKDASGEINLADESIIRSWGLVKEIGGTDEETRRIIDLLLINWAKTTKRIKETVRKVWQIQIFLLVLDTGPLSKSSPATWIKSIFNVVALFRLVATHQI